MDRSGSPYVGLAADHKNAHAIDAFGALAICDQLGYV
jgi:hypothetical protein